MSKGFVLLILSALCATTAGGAGFCPAAYADNAEQEATDKMFGEYEGQAFRNSFFSQRGRSGQPGEATEASGEWQNQLKKRRQEKLARREAEEIIAEKDKVERRARLQSIFDRDESAVLDQHHVIRTFESNFEKKVLPDFYPAEERSGAGLFPRPGELNERDRKRRDLAELAGPLPEVTGDWLPSKLDPDSNGGFTISPDNGSPVPYKLNGHVDVQRGRPWNDNNN